MENDVEVLVIVALCMCGTEEQEHSTTKQLLSIYLNDDAQFFWDRAQHQLLDCLSIHARSHTFIT